MRFQGKELVPYSRMGRSRLVYKLLYAGVVVLCLISCWNARLLYKAQDDAVPPKHADFMKKVIGQRDILFDTVGLLREKCSGEKLHLSRNFSCNKPRLWNKPGDVDLAKALVLGYRRDKPTFLTIGIPTVLRETESYLGKTLDSLIENSTPDERAETTIVIFLADQLEENRHITKTMLMDNYLSHLEEGFIQVIQAPPSFYPPLQGLKRNFGDSEDRVRWRSKQVVDFAFMFLYAQSLSEYYMHIEDDVVTTSGYMSAIHNYIDQMIDVEWVTLEFSILGFIGKLFHASDLDRLAQFVMFFYEDQPVDFLYKYFNVLNGQKEVYLRVPSLFQHRGEQSSLKNKKMDAQDRFFEPDQPQFRDSDNPSGSVYSSLQHFGMYRPQLCYSPLPGFFWGISPQAGNSIVLVFDTPTHVSRIAVVTGTTNHPADIIRNGLVELSPKLLRSGDGSKIPECSGYREVGRFLKGQLDITDVGQTFAEEVACVQVRLLESQDQWMAIREIAIWTPH